MTTHKNKIKKIRKHLFQMVLLGKQKKYTPVIIVRHVNFMTDKKYCHFQ